MSAYVIYEINGRTRQGRPVTIVVRALSAPPPEAAAWLLRERYPSAVFTALTRPAARDYAPPEQVITAKDLAVSPVGRVT